MRKLTALEEQAIAVSRPHLIVLKLSGANAGRGEQPVLRGHVFTTPQETVPQEVLQKAAAHFRGEVQKARDACQAALSAPLPVLSSDPLATDDNSETGRNEVLKEQKMKLAAMDALLADPHSLSLPHTDLLTAGRVSLVWMGPGDQWNARRLLALPAGSIAVIDFVLLVRIIRILVACLTEGYDRLLALPAGSIATDAAGNAAHAADVGVLKLLIEKIELVRV